jgi:glutathione S-transferase
MTIAPLSWVELEALTDFKIDPVNGPTNPQARLRLFGFSEAEVRVTLYRDNHAWCPYCQKVECVNFRLIQEKEQFFKITFITMSYFCYPNWSLFFSDKINLVFVRFGFA